MAFKAPNYDAEGNAPPDESDAASKAGTGNGSGMAETLGGSKPSSGGSFGPGNPAAAKAEAMGPTTSAESDYGSSSKDEDGDVFQFPGAEGVGMPGRDGSASKGRVLELKPSDA